MHKPAALDQCNDIFYIACSRLGVGPYDFLMALMGKVSALGFAWLA